MKPQYRRRAVFCLALAPLAARTAALPNGRVRLDSGVRRSLAVGTHRPFQTLAAAVAAARPGDVIEVDMGVYAGDVALIDKDFLHIIGVGGRPRLTAAGRSAEAKGILVVRANGVEIENLELHGARVDDHYGCGVRLERGSLRLRRCRFADNELGLMTTNDPAVVLEIVDCEFSGLVEPGERGGALSHSLYAGTIDSLRVEGSYFHDGSAGHLIKSRARSSTIRYNRISDENGTSSYELEFPNGGAVEVVGNLIQQGRRSQNGVIASYGAEGLRWQDNRLEMLFNTFVNDLPAGGTYVLVHATGISAGIRHNVLVGKGEFKGVSEDMRSNVRAVMSDFADASTLDYRPRVGTAWLGKASGLEPDFPKRLLPRSQYRHPASTEDVPQSSLGFRSPGAFQTVAPQRP